MRNLSLASQWESHARGHGKKKKGENEQTGTGGDNLSIFHTSKRIGHHKAIGKPMSGGKQERPNEDTQGGERTSELGERGRGENDN